MATADNLSHTDPTDLDALREALAASDPDGKLNHIGISWIEIEPEALDLLTDTVSELTRSERVLLVADGTQPLRYLSSLVSSRLDDNRTDNRVRQTPEDRVRNVYRFRHSGRRARRGEEKDGEYEG